MERVESNGTAPEITKFKRCIVKIKPSFWLFIAAAVLFKQGFFALNYAIAVFLHELSHYFAASRLFYHCKQIQVSIFGAVLYGDFADVTPSDRIKIAFAGPLCNLVLAVVCLALWWAYPQSYYFSENFFTANISMACVNLLPCYPLDGGRALTGLLEAKLGKKALKLTKIITAVLSLLLFGIFLVSLVTRHNLFSLGLFAIFLFCGVLGNSKECYVKTTFSQNRRKFLKKGMEKKTLVFSRSNKLADVAKRMQGNFLYCLEVVDENMEVISRYSVAQLEHLVLTVPLTTPLADLKKF